MCTSSRHSVPPVRRVAHAACLQLGTGIGRGRFLVGLGAYQSAPCLATLFAARVAIMFRVARFLLSFLAVTSHASAGCIIIDTQPAISHLANMICHRSASLHKGLSKSRTLEWLPSTPRQTASSSLRGRLLKCHTSIVKPKCSGDDKAPHGDAQTYIWRLRLPGKCASSNTQRDIK